MAMNSIHIYLLTQTYILSQPAKKERPVTNRNISFFEQFSSRIEGSVYLIQIFLKYRRTYSNYLNVFFHVIKNKYPVKGILKNGNQVMLTSFFQSYNFARFQDHRKKVDYDILTDTVTISRFANKELKFHDGIYNGDLVNIFLKDVYRIVPIEGNVVLDIGANIGDSSIYFALRGAAKVIAVEPFPHNYEMAKKNIALNYFSDKISVILAGCTPNAGYINISDLVKSGIDSHTYDDAGYKVGMNVPSVTLENILKEYNIQNGETILKMDCEGCEYDSILSASNTVLRQFSHMLIEYHDGYKNLRERLEKSGFEVCPFKITGELGGPTALPKLEGTGKWYYMGYIYAKRR
jgi:FkbM family methyltransferase